MKNFLLFIAILSATITLSAQTASNLAFEFPSMEGDYPDKVRIHIAYASNTGVFSYRLHTSLQDEPVKLKSREYVLLVTEEEKIGFFQNSAVNDLPVQLSFEKGKDYYFRIALNTADGFWNGFHITEMTERAFQMDLFARNISPKPEIYDYTTEAPLK